MKLSRTAPAATPHQVSEGFHRTDRPPAGELTHNAQDSAGPKVDPLQVGAAMPKSIGRCADLYHDIRELRLMMEKESEAIKARETEIQEHIINNLSKSDDTGAAGLRYRAQVKQETKPQIADWKELTGYILENDRFDLLQKRLGEKAVADLWDAGTVIPGVAKVHVPKLSITKI